MSHRELLEIQGLKVYYFTKSKVFRAVDGVDMNIGRGKVVAVVGESGSGKTTLIQSILRVLPSEAGIVEGRILFEGIDLTRLDDKVMEGIRGKKISMVFQDPHSYLNPVLTIGDQFSDYLIYSLGYNRSSAKNEVTKYLGMVGINDPYRVAKSYPHQLSGGMAQRVMIAMALASKPSLLLADEPTSALDPTIQFQILRLLKDLKATLGFSIMMVTHDLSLVAYVADYVYVMYAGKVCEHGDVRSIFKSPRHPYTQALLSSAIDIRRPSIEYKPLKGSVPDLSNPPPGCRFYSRCPYAMEKCKSEEPILKKTGETYTACHLYS